jgi:hypothetical protein
MQGPSINGDLLSNRLSRFLSVSADEDKKRPGFFNTLRFRVRMISAGDILSNNSCVVILDKTSTPRILPSASNTAE